jgi:hypothetical protein
MLYWTFKRSMMSGNVSVKSIRYGVGALCCL